MTDICTQTMVTTSNCYTQVEIGDFELEEESENEWGTHSSSQSADGRHDDYFEYCNISNKYIRRGQDSPASDNTESGENKFNSSQTNMETLNYNYNRCTSTDEYGNRCHNLKNKFTQICKDCILGKPFILSHESEINFSQKSVDSQKTEIDFSQKSEDSTQITKRLKTN